MIACSVCPATRASPPSNSGAYHIENQLVCELASRRCVSRAAKRETDLTRRLILPDAFGAAGGAYASASRAGASGRIAGPLSAITVDGATLGIGMLVSIWTAAGHCRAE